MYTHTQTHTKQTNKQQDKQTHTHTYTHTMYAYMLIPAFENAHFSPKTTIYRLNAQIQSKQKIGIAKASRKKNTKHKSVINYFVFFCCCSLYIFMVLKWKLYVERMKKKKEK